MVRLKLIQNIIDKKRKDIKLDNFDGTIYRNPILKWRHNICLKTFKNKPINYLEIGSYHGASALLIAQSYCQHKDSKIFCIDPWEDYEEYPEYKEQNNNNFNIFMKNINNSEHKNKINVIRGYSEKEVPKLQDNFFDIIYIDGNHEEEYVYNDAILSYNKLKNNGYMIFDDYDWEGVRKAVNRFRKRHNVKLIRKRSGLIIFKK